MRLNHVNGLLGPERYLGISSFEVGRVYVFEAMNSVLIIFFFKVVLYIYFKLCKQTRGKMCNFEDCLIYIGLGNIFQPPVFIL